jgi:mono/diheme cytochrome c family protein
MFGAIEPPFREFETIFKRGMTMKKLLITLFLFVFAVPSVALADGKSDFKNKCAACHGSNANLLPKTARLLKVDPRKLALKASQMNREEMIAIIEKGKDKMPVFEKELTKDQITAVVDYILDLRKKK